MVRSKQILNSAVFKECLKLEFDVKRLDVDLSIDELTLRGFNLLISNFFGSFYGLIYRM